MAGDAFGRVVSLGEPGFNGSGGGALSGSELSHLRSHVSWNAVVVYATRRMGSTYIGIILESNECECLTSSRSRESSLSVDGILYVNYGMVVWWMSTQSGNTGMEFGLRPEPSAWFPWW